jgi:hypothetical protein
MNIFEKMEIELDAQTQIKKITLGRVANMLLEVAWRNEEDRAEAEKIAAKYRHGICKGGMISGLPTNQGAMYSTSWSDHGEFFRKHPEEYECNSSIGELLRRKTIDKIACRIKVEENKGFNLESAPTNFQLGNFCDVVEDMFNNEYDCGFKKDKDFSELPDGSFGDIIDFYELRSEITKIMYNYLNKTITLDKFNTKNTYPDMSFDIVEIKGTKKIMFRNIRVHQPLEFEKTGKAQIFLKDQSGNSK